MEMDMDLNELPIIDWEMATRLAGNKRDVAEELLDLMITSLPADMLAIKQLEAEQNYSELLKRVHKLHGAMCYLGLPRIKTLLSHLETDLKNNIMVSLPSLVNQLDTEVSVLLRHYSRLN